MLMLILQVIYMHVEINSLKKNIVGKGTGVHVPPPSNYIKTYALVMDIPATINRAVWDALFKTVEDLRRESTMISCAQGKTFHAPIVYTNTVFLFVQKTASALHLIDDVIAGHTQYVYVFDRGFRVRYSPQLMRTFMDTFPNLLTLPNEYDIILLMPLQEFTTEQAGCSQPRQADVFFGGAQNSSMDILSMLSQRSKTHSSTALITMMGYKYHG